MRCVIVLAVAAAVAMSTGVPGGKTEQDPSKPEYLEKVWNGVKGLNEGSNDGANHLIPVKVLSAKSQVVAGTKWHFEVLVAESECSRGTVAASELSKEKCTLKPGGQRAIYNITLWEKPWENFQQFNVEKVRSVAATEQI